MFPINIAGHKIWLEWYSTRRVGIQTGSHKGVVILYELKTKKYGTFKRINWWYDWDACHEGDWEPIFTS